MTRIDVNYFLRFDSKKSYQQYLRSCPSLSDTVVKWDLMEHSIEMHLNTETVKFIITEESSPLVEIYSKYLETHPNSAHAQNKLKQLKCATASHIEPMLQVTCNIDADISKENNRVAFPEDEQIDIETFIENDLCYGLVFNPLDGLFYDQLREQSRGFFFALLLSNINIWGHLTGTVEICINGEKYREEVFADHGYLDQFMDSTHRSIMREQLSIEQCWTWIVKNTSICGKKAHSPVCFTALTYVFNRDSFESLMYANIGLESIYMKKGEKGLSAKLQQRIKAIMPFLDEKRVKDIYNMRSRFVHGSAEFSIFDSYSEFDDDDTTLDLVDLAKALLLETICLLIHNNASKLQFEETVTPHYC